MSGDNRFKDPKKNFPATFFLVLLGIGLLVVTVQNFLTTRHAKVAFSHQVEHLANLNLVIPEENRKVSLNDNLVTFRGRFRDGVTEEGKERFRYLELLEENHNLSREHQEIETHLAELSKKIQEAGELFLEISGLPIPQGGYRVVGESFNSSGKLSAVVIRELPKQDFPSIAELKAQLVLLRGSGSDLGKLTQFENSLSALVEGFRSPVLGIGAESVKQELRTIQKEVADLQARQEVDATLRLASYDSLLSELQKIADKLNQPVNGSRLTELRAVREYRDEILRLQENRVALDQNEVQLEKARQQVAGVSWYFNNQELSTRALEKQDNEVYSRWFHSAKEEWNNVSLNGGLPFKAPDQPRNLVLEKTFKSQEPSPNYFSYLFTILPIVMVVLLLYFVFSRQMKGMGGGAMNFGKSPARLLQKGQHKVTFKDVAGIDEAKEELMEVVDFLKCPSKFTTLGGRIPKGILCVGPPGTGKTLIAKAVAGEADRPFFSIAGSDFVEMFVGVGASRIRDMFEQARKAAPCIIFIDEIDAVGRHRGAGIGGGHDEREQTLNQLLVEMDGFDTSEGVILMAATNRPDILDKALLRPGRFDRRVVIGLPDLKGRLEILKVHARKIKLDTTVDLTAVARATPGASGADLENILNEAALLAARRGRTAVTSPDVLDARDKVLYGKERRSLEVDLKEKRTTAYHEAGHAVVGFYSEHADPLDKVTIIPRGMSLGATHFLPEKNRVNFWKREALDQLAVMMGGRCAEEIFVHDISSGAQHDFAQATKLARAMVCVWGMSDLLGTVAYDDGSSDDAYPGMPHDRGYSEETARAIDLEVRRILDEAYASAKERILAHKEEIEQITEMLIEFETLDAQDVKDILNHEWDIEKKRVRLLESENRFKYSTTPPPPPQEIARDPNLGVVGT